MAGKHLRTPLCPQGWAEQPFTLAGRLTHPPNDVAMWTHVSVSQKEAFHLTQDRQRGPITLAVIGSVGNVGGG